MVERDGREHPVCRMEKTQAESLNIYRVSSAGPGPSWRHYSKGGIRDEMRQNKVFKCFSLPSRGGVALTANMTPPRGDWMITRACRVERAGGQGGFPPGKEGVRFTVCPLRPRWWWTVEHLSFNLVLFADGGWKRRTKGRRGLVRHPVLASEIKAGGVYFLSELIRRTRCAIAL